jgi:hypothetical protein
VLYENPLSQEALEWTGVCISSKILKELLRSFLPFFSRDVLARRRWSSDIMLGTSRLVLPAHSVRFPEASRRYLPWPPLCSTYLAPSSL